MSYYGQPSPQNNGQGTSEWITGGLVIGIIVVLGILFLINAYSKLYAAQEELINNAEKRKKQLMEGNGNLVSLIDGLAAKKDKMKGSYIKTADIETRVHREMMHI